MKQKRKSLKELKAEIKTLKEEFKTLKEESESNITIINDYKNREQTEAVKLVIKESMDRNKFIIDEMIKISNEINKISNEIEKRESRILTGVLFGEMTIIGALCYFIGVKKGQNNNHVRGLKSKDYKQGFGDGVSFLYETIEMMDENGTQLNVKK